MLKLILASGTILACAAPHAAFAQAVPDGQTTPDAATPTGAATPVTGAALSDSDPQEDAGGRDILVTGSRIKQDPNDSALPLQIVTTQELQRNGIVSPEQLISFLAANGNGADNLASNSDVVSGAARGTNGLSAANLRGQGSASTLVLLNGRRIAAHGLQGSAVDVNQIPFAAIDRVEVLKDGASAIYGTDAVGGVINFITKSNFTGIDVSGFSDITEEGDAPIYRLSGTVGYGKLDEQGFNVMAAVSKSWNGALFGRDRDFVNGNQPNRGLSIDTRGTPLATTVPINPSAAGIGNFQNGTLLGGTTGATSLAANPGFFIPGTTIPASGGVNPLRLPGGGGMRFRRWRDELRFGALFGAHYGAGLFVGYGARGRRSSSRSIPSPITAAPLPASPARMKSMRRSPDRMRIRRRSFRTINTAPATRRCRSPIRSTR